MFFCCAVVVGQYFCKELEVCFLFSLWAIEVDFESVELDIRDGYSSL